MEQPTEPENKVPHLDYLRRLVTLLSATMIGGMIILIILFVIRFQQDILNVPPEITLPSGVTPIAFTQTRDWYAVVTQENKILLFTPKGKLFQTVEIIQ
jgi:hypothetical protein